MKVCCHITSRAAVVVCAPPHLCRHSLPPRLMAMCVPILNSSFHVPHVLSVPSPLLSFSLCLFSLLCFYNLLFSQASYSKSSFIQTPFATLQTLSWPSQRSLSTPFFSGNLSFQTSFLLLAGRCVPISSMAKSHGAMAKGRTGMTGCNLAEQWSVAARGKESFEDTALWLALIFRSTATDVFKGETFLLPGRVQESSPVFPIWWFLFTLWKRTALLSL